MSYIDIISGFLGAGKTTLIQKLLKEAYQDEKVVLIENEFGEIGIDGGFLKDAGIEIKEMNSGCICCSLVGDFSEALKKVVDTYHPDRIIIEPSGVGKLSDVKQAVLAVNDERLTLDHLITVVDGKKCRLYLKNFGEFFSDQVKNAQLILVSKTDAMDAHQLQATLELLKQENPAASYITTPWTQLNTHQILDAAKNDLAWREEKHPCQHGHHDHEDHEECGCGHHHDHEDHEECSCEHHHDHEDHEKCGCGDHHDHEDHEECGCGHHHADEVFTSWGKETVLPYSKEQLENILTELQNTERYGQVLRAKGIVSGDEDAWFYFDFVPEEMDIRLGTPSTIGKFCVIGAGLHEEALEELFMKR